MSLVLFALPSFGGATDLPAPPGAGLSLVLETTLGTIESRFKSIRPTTDTIHAWQNLGTAIRLARFVQARYAVSPDFTNLFAEAVNDAKYWAQQIASGPALTPRTGLAGEGYYSANDGSFQPFLRYLPQKVGKKTALPLVVYLHGYSPYLDLVNWRSLPQTLIEFAEQAGFCIAAPFGRGNTDYQGIGEQDVLRVIREMQARYRIDPDRIILAGVSMGGMGVWTIGAHYPHLFAGLLVISGRGDYCFWHGVEPAELPLYKRILTNAEFGFSLLPNLTHMAVMCVHGASDNVISVEEARHMMRALRKVNPTARYIEVENGDHWIYEDVFRRDDIRTWLRSQRRVIPLEFEYVTYLPRYDHFYWLRADGFSHLELPARIVVRRSGEQIAISARGVRGLWVDRRVLPRAIRNSRIAAEDGLRLNSPDQKPEPRRHGPIKDAFLQPFVFVCAADPSDTAAREKFYQAVMDWYRFAKAWPRVVDEHLLETESLSKYNLFFFGEPESSRLVSQILETSPVRAVGTRILVGDHAFPRDGHGLYLVRPSPWSTNRVVVVQCGVAWGRGLPENHRYDFLPDFIVYSETFDKDGSNTAVCAGFFDENWALVPSLMTMAPHGIAKPTQDITAYR